MIAALSRQQEFAVTRIANGTNLFRLRVNGDAAGFQKRLATRGVLLPPPASDTFTIGVNETWNRMAVSELADAFVRAASSPSPA